MSSTFRSWAFLLPFGLAFLLGYWGMQDAPQRMPTHWGPDGQPNAWGSPFEALILSNLYLLPGPLLVVVIEKFSGSNRRNAPILQVVSFGFGLLALLMTAGQVFHWDSTRTLLIGLGALFTLIGNVLGRAQPSAFLGIRTPWTYLSRRSWHATQRFAGLWFTIFGVCLLLSGFLAPPLLLTPWISPDALIVSTLLLVLGVVYKSYHEYKRDPDPQPVDLRPHNVSA